ncbi:unnamed protein product, partial [Oppiella nova]
YFKRKCDYWEKQGVRTDSVGLYTRLTKQWYDWERDLYVRNGKCFGVYELGKPVLYLSDPDLIRDVLVKDFHEFTTGDPMFENMVFMARDSEWKRIRAVMSPTFTTGKLGKMTPLIRECVDTMTDNFDKLIAKSGAKLAAPVDVKPIAGAFSMESIIQVAFGRKVSALDDPKNPIIENARKLFSTNFWTMVKFTLLLFAPSVAKMLNLSPFDQKVAEFYRNFTLNLIDDRKRDEGNGSPVKRVDFLQLMLDSMKDNKKTINDSEDYTDSKSDEKYREIQPTDDMIDKSLSYDEVIAQCVLFFMAGYETTATTLSLCLYTIAKHPEVQQKLYQEIQTFHGNKKSGADSYETLMSMKYLEAVIAETQRLYPGAIFVERVANEDYELRGTGITIKKDHIVHIPIYAMHRDPDYFTDPELFRPERFLAENIAHNPYTYLPFGAGPRNCLGMRLAQLEIKLALVSLVHRYVFHTTEKPLEFGFSGGLKTPKSVELRVERR